MAQQTKKKSPDKSHSGQSIGWQLAEEVAALLEKSITPSAKVEHNVRLPVIGKTRRRQCDVVITYGEQPRQTIAIVEVQKRERKPDINTFHGWCRKMEEVGAQHLICVSIKGYPKSIIEEVSITYGPKIKLLTLAELREQKISSLFFIHPFVFHQIPHFTLESFGPGLKLESCPVEKELTLSSNDRVFTVNKNQEFENLDELIAHALPSLSHTISQMFIEKGIKEPTSYSLDVNLGSTETDLWLHSEDQQYKVLSLPVRLRAEVSVTKIPLTIFSYQQQFVDGVLAWVALSKGVIEGKDVSVQLVFKESKEGLLQINAIRQQGVESVFLFLSPDKATIETYAADKISIAK